jgi:hypothetical protein
LILRRQTLTFQGGCCHKYTEWMWEEIAMDFIVGLSRT